MGEVEKRILECLILVSFLSSLLPEACPEDETEVVNYRNRLAVNEVGFPFLPVSCSYEWATTRGTTNMKVPGEEPQ
ncbi:hypothetical protein EDD16DRAFT_1601514 [Pisolithus croceorrhizus]|nr:hypothetical protein EDD16DRAFT_1601514 [Pisolithus croceorrhizus]